MENESESWINNGSKFHFLTAPWYRRDAHALCLDYKINPISVTHTIYSNVSSPLGTVATLHAFVRDPDIYMHTHLEFGVENGMKKKKES